MYGGIVSSTCRHGFSLGSNTCLGCSYDKNYKKCKHNQIESNCRLCNINKYKTVQKVCQHWNSITDECYSCEREKKRLNHFQHETIKLNENNLFNDTNTMKDYTNPYNINKNYPQTVNNNRTNIEAKNEISGRENNNRTNDMINGNINSFMKRSLETLDFIENNNNQNLWHNPIINNSFPNFYFSNDDNHNTTMGISTRGGRKLDDTNFNNNLHLQRSMLQPDFRQGNRFYEDKPSNTRRDSYRGIGNQNVLKFQDQTKKMYNDLNYTKAYDTAAGINRG